MSTDDQVLANQLAAELQHADRSLFDSLNDEEKRLAISMMAEMRDNLSRRTLDTLWEIDYRHRPVDVGTFLTHKDYLNLDVIASAQDESRTSGIFKTWYDTLVELFRPDKNYWELILSSAIGVGKTSCAVYALVYKLYRMSCLRDPQKFYGLLPGHGIVFGVYNIFKYKAQGVAVSYFREAVERCAYFRENFPLNPRKTSEIEFPSSVRVSYGASALSAIGENIFSVLIDETEFMKAQASEDEKGQAWNLYNSTLRRMESRYMRGGEIPGVMVQISSKASADSYLADRIKNRGSADDVLIVEKAAWDVKPWRYKGPRFRVFAGDNYSDPRLVSDADYEAATDRTGMIAVPVEHRMAFEEDIHGALRDLANIASGATAPLIPRRDRIHECIDPTRNHPFTKLEFHIGLEDNESIEDYLHLDSVLRTTQSMFIPKVRPTVGRYIHLDLAVSGDALGFCMGHVSGFRETKRMDPSGSGHEHEVRVPCIYIDMILRIVPVKGSKIRLSAVRDFIFALRGYGFAINKVSSDSYQSVDLLQQLARSGFTTEPLSVDIAREKHGHPYAFLREAIIEQRVNYYHYPQLLAELANLQRFDIVQGGRMKWRVDHPAKMMDLDGNPIKGAKDLADALCGCVMHCMMQPPDDDPAKLTATDVLAKSKPTKKPRFMQSDQSWVIGDYR